MTGGWSERPWDHPGDQRRRYGRSVAPCHYQTSYPTGRLLTLTGPIPRRQVRTGPWALVPWATGTGPRPRVRGAAGSGRRPRGAGPMVRFPPQVTAQIHGHRAPRAHRGNGGFALPRAACARRVRGPGRWWSAWAAGARNRRKGGHVTAALGRGNLRVWGLSERSGSQLERLQASECPFCIRRTLQPVSLAEQGDNWFGGGKNRTPVGK